MTQHPDWDEYDAWHEDDEPFDCGAWFNGHFRYYHCTKAGSEECDFECPMSALAREQRRSIEGARD